MNYQKKILLVTTMVLVLSVTASCMIGGKLKNIHVANHPSGDNVNLILHNDEEVGGEMLGVDSNYLFLLLLVDDKNQIVKVSWNQLDSLRIGNSTWRITLPITSDQFREKALRSRYPQGISDMLLSDLLRAYGQDEVKVI